MVAVGIDRAALESAGAGDPHAVVPWLRCRAPRPASASTTTAIRSDSLRFQLFGVGDHRLALGETGGQGEDRQFVDGQRDLGTFDPGSRERRPSGP